LEIITSGLEEAWKLFPAVAIDRNMGTGYADFPLCKSQQGY
jgi:hypothetical protein